MVRALNDEKMELELKLSLERLLEEDEGSQTDF